MSAFKMKLFQIFIRAPIESSYTFRWRTKCIAYYTQKSSNAPNIYYLITNIWINSLWISLIHVGTMKYNCLSRDRLSFSIFTYECQRSACVCGMSGCQSCALTSNGKKIYFQLTFDERPECVNITYVQRTYWNEMSVKWQAHFFFSSAERSHRLTYRRYTHTQY